VVAGVPEVVEVEAGQPAGFGGALPGAGEVAAAQRRILRADGHEAVGARSSELVQMRDE